jgi:hypothetical protein
VSGIAECAGCAYEAHDDFTNFSELVMFSNWFFFLVELLL